MTTLVNIEKKTVNEIITFVIDRISDYEGTEAQDLHNNLFNTDYYIVGNWQAEQWLIANGGIFNAIGDIHEYELENFGETQAYYNAEKTVNMFVYIIGELVLSEVKHIRLMDSHRLTTEDIAIIKDELTAML